MFRTPRLVTLLAVMVLAVVVAACSSNGGDGGGATDTDGNDDTAFADPGDCIVVEVASSPEKITLLGDLARLFNDEGNQVGDDCIFVRPRRASSGEAMALLADGWGEDARLDEAEGPAPVIWSPAASSWGAILDQRRAEQGQPAMAGEGTPFMLTPLVIAMPEPMAEALGWPETDIGWTDILELSRDDEGWAGLGHPEWGEFRLGKTNPNFSTSGLSALIAQLYAATGETRDLSVEDLGNPEVIEFARDIESAVVHYGDTTLTFLDNWYAADQRGTALNYASAAAVEEKSIIDYNRGDPDGILEPGEEPRPPRIPLVAIYPSEGTLYSDNPLFVLDAPWVSDAQRDAAELFIEFVQRPEHQERVLEFGFRPGNPAVAIGPPIGPELGADPDRPDALLQTPAPEVMTGILDFWAEHRKGARVMLMVDVSGSMGELADPETGATRLELAVQAATASLDQFKADDEIGLRVFTTGVGPDGNWEELVAPGPLADNEGDLRDALGSLRPTAGTPLYDATFDAFEFAVDTYDPDRINAVIVLSDGQNDDGDRSDDPAQLQSLLDRLAEEGASELGRPVRVFPIAYSGEADVSALRQIAEASNAALYEASDPRSIDKVLAAVVSNF